MSTESPEDVDALKARIADLESQQAAGGFTWRGLTAWVVLVVAAILFPIALTAFWGQKTLLDTDRYLETVGPLASDPTVQAAIADKVSATVTTQIQDSARLDELLNDYPRLKPLLGPLTAGLGGFVHDQTLKIVQSDQFAQLWRTVNTEIHKGVVYALEGNPNGAISLQGDQVVLDTGDLINAVKQRLVDRGLTIVENLPVPPAADRQVVLLTAPQLSQARFAYAVGQPIAQWLIYVVLLLFIIAVLIAIRRARMVMAVGIAMILGAMVIRLGMAFGQSQLDATLAPTFFAQAQDAFWTSLTGYLLLAVRAAFALGLVLAVVGWYLSGTRSATATRTYLSKVINGAGVGAGDTALGRAGGWFARTRTFWRAFIVAFAGVVIVTTSPLTGSTILWTAIIAVVAFVVLEFLVAAGRAHADLPSNDAAAAAAEGDTADEVGAEKADAASS
jgi:hypothetical protein